MVLRLAQYTSSLFGCTQSIPIHITFCLVVPRVFLYSSQSPWWYSNYLFTHHSQPGGTQTIPILITVYLMAQTIPLLIRVSLVVLRLSLYSSQSLRWYSDYPFTHHSLFGDPQFIPIHITFCLVILRLSLYS